jgi:catechol 2,3-dioxygenase
MNDVAHIGHVELLTPRAGQSLAFFTQVLGMEVVATAGPSVYLRGYGDYERVGLKLTEAPAAGLGHLALRTASAAALARCVAAIERAGRGEGWIDADLGHGPAYRFRDPEGHLLELYHETERQPAQPGLARNRSGRRGGPGVGVKRLDHLNLFARDVAANRAFAQQCLGLRLLDSVLDDDGAESAAFLTTSITPLDLVYVADVPAGRARLHHVAFWVDTRDEVLRAADVLLDAGVPIEVAPALHTIGQSFFVYAFEPGGNRIEVTTGADLQLDPDGPVRVWTAQERRAGIGWGTTFPPTWTSRGTPPLP